VESPELEQDAETESGVELAPESETEAFQQLQRAADACYLAQLALMRVRDLTGQDQQLRALLAGDIAEARRKAWLMVQIIDSIDEYGSSGHKASSCDAFRPEPARPAVAARAARPEHRSPSSAARRGNPMCGVASAAMRAATSDASRVLPAPPGPTSVTRRLESRACPTRLASSSRPTKLVRWARRLVRTLPGLPFPSRGTSRAALPGRRPAGQRRGRCPARRRARSAPPRRRPGPAPQAWPRGWRPLPHSLVGHQSFKAERVHVIRAGRQPITGCRLPDRIRPAQRSACPRHQGLQGVRRVRRRFVAPDRFGQRRRAHRLPSGQRQPDN
jgi:hypothetical protein